ncbi:MAG TPA: hypothetical protein VG937_25590 [Polyangiaceae bacterium]|nr:hypothetical protein [Polyangiaceae bacterium]
MGRVRKQRSRWGASALAVLLLGLAIPSCGKVEEDGDEGSAAGGDAATDGGSQSVSGGHESASGGVAMGATRGEASGGRASGSGGATGGADVSVSVSGAGAAGAATCDQLQREAEQTFRAQVSITRACEVDYDCTHLNFLDTCVGMCGVVVSKGRALSLFNAVPSICLEFFEHGCTAFPISCPAPGVPTCQLGSCVER